MKIKGKGTVYLVVYACEPNQGGEHEVGWRIANELSESCNLVVITRKANQKLIDQSNEKNLKIEFLENEKMIGFKPKGKFSYIYYLFWQLSVYFFLRKKVSKDDIVHYLTFGNIHLPHFLFLLKSKLIIGPMGGGSVIEPKLLRTPSLRLRLKSNLHKLVNLTVKINPLYYVLFFKTSKIILRTDETLRLIPKMFHNKCTVFLETGVNIQKLNVVKKKRTLQHIITTARIIDSKNVDQVIDVFQRLLIELNHPIKLSILGGGPLKAQLEKRYSTVKGVEFLGKIPHEKVEGLLQQADLFLFCSVKEGGSHSLFEAAMNNCPIACYDVSGMREFPKSNSAIKITPTSDIDDNINTLAEQIKLAFSNNHVDLICSNAIIDLQENYDWQKLGKKYIKLYNKL